MSCKFYTFRQGDYYCIKKEEEVDSDWYYKYCRKYDYDDCPIYKQEESSGCFLTSACVESRGLTDDCYELEILRSFRDTWLKSSEEGLESIKKYYEIAPQIVSSINEKKNSAEIYDGIYENMIVPCIQFIECKKYENAMELYRNVTLQLEKEYC